MCVDRPAIKIEFDDVLCGNELGRDPACHQIAVGVFAVPNGYVTPAVEQALIGENAAGRDQVFDEFRVGRAGGCRRRRLLRGGATGAKTDQRTNGEQNRSPAAMVWQRTGHDRLQ